MDVSCTLGSNLLLQVAPYKPSVPSQVSQIKKTKAFRLELQRFLSLPREKRIHNIETAALEAEIIL